MGSKHSGAVSDAAFLDLVERDILSPSSRKEHGIFLNARYRDDIFVILGDPFDCPGFHNRLLSLASPLYTIERESFSLVLSHASHQFLQAWGFRWSLPP